MQTGRLTRDNLPVFFLILPDMDKEKMETTNIYTDGGCSGNPGPGAWAAVILSTTGKQTFSGAEKNTTNNRMELKAVIGALKALRSDDGVSRVIAVHTDSQYVKKGITEWIHKWMKNGWLTSSKEPVKNRDLWQELHDLSNVFAITWHWVKGHADNEFNNKCDALVQQEIKKLQG